MKTYTIQVRDGFTVQYWYARPNWVVQKMDPQGNQIGDAAFVYTKREAGLEAAVYANHSEWIKGEQGET